MDTAGCRVDSELAELVAMGIQQRVLPAGLVEPFSILHALPQGGIPFAAGDLRAQDHRSLPHIQVGCAAPAIVLNGLKLLTRGLMFDRELIEFGSQSARNQRTIESG